MSLEAVAAPMGSLSMEGIVTRGCALGGIEGGGAMARMRERSFWVVGVSMAAANLRVFGAGMGCGIGVVAGRFWG